MKVAINDCHGGFGLSHKAVMRYAELKGIKLYPWLDSITKNIYKEKATLDNPSMVIHYTTVPEEEYNQIATFKKSNAVYFSDKNIPRTDPLLIQVIEELGEEANGRPSHLKIVEIPDGIEYEIEEYDGMEWIAEKHKTWG